MGSPTFSTSVLACLDRTGERLPYGLPEHSCGRRGAYLCLYRPISAATAVASFVFLVSVFADVDLSSSAYPLTVLSILRPRLILQYLHLSFIAGIQRAAEA